MAWESSDRRSRLPDDWSARVKAVWKRDGGRCTWKLPSDARCPRHGADVDHRVNDDNHELWNLRLLCAHHHGKKTAQEGVRGRRQKRETRKKGRTERQPGTLR